MAHNDLEAQRSIVLSFRIQELHQLLTYGGMSKSGNKPTLQVHSNFKTLFVDFEPCSEASLRNGRIFKGPQHVDQNTRAVQTGGSILCRLFELGILGS